MMYAKEGQGTVPVSSEEGCLCPSRSAAAEERGAPCSPFRRAQHRGAGGLWEKSLPVRTAFKGCEHSSQQGFPRLKHKTQVLSP